LPVQKRIIDNGARSQITNSKLQHYIDDQGLRGVLSNFQRLQATIEEKKYPIDLSTLAHQNLKRSAGYKYDYGVADLGYERLNRQVIETSIHKTSGFSIYFFHTLIKQRPII